MSEFRKFTPRSVAMAVTPMFIFASSLVMGSCASVPEFKPSDCDFPPRVLNPETNQKLASIQRAATLKIFNSQASGTGSLVEQNNELYLYTIRHVAEDIRLSKGGCVIFPSIDFRGLLDPRKFIYHPKTAKTNDVIVSYLLNQQVSERLKVAINQRVLTPLQTDSRAILNQSLVGVPRPDTGRITYLRYIGITEDGDQELGFTGAGAICEGRSGGAVLATENGVITNRMVGIMYAVDINRRIPDPAGTNLMCSNRAFSIPVR